MSKPRLLSACACLAILLSVATAGANVGIGDRSQILCPDPYQPGGTPGPGTGTAGPALPPNAPTHCGPSDFAGHPATSNRDPILPLVHVANPGQHNPLPAAHPRNAQEMCAPTAPHVQSITAPVVNTPPTDNPHVVDNHPHYAENFNDLYGATYTWPTGDVDPWLEDVHSPDALPFPEYRYHFDPNEVAGQAGSPVFGLQHEDPDDPEGDPLAGVDTATGQDLGWVRLGSDGYYRGYFDAYDFPGDLDVFYPTVHPDNQDGVDNDRDGTVDVATATATFKRPTQPNGAYAGSVSYEYPIGYDRDWAGIAEQDKPEPVLDLPVLDGPHADDDRGFDIDVVFRADNLGEFCAYAAYDPDGPYYFVGSSYPEDAQPPIGPDGSPIGYLAAYRFDLSRFYTPMALGDSDDCNGNRLGIDPGEDCIVGSSDDRGPDSRFRTGRARFLLIEASQNRHPLLSVDFAYAPSHDELRPQEFAEHFPTRHDVITFTPHVESYNRPPWVLPPPVGYTNFAQIPDPIVSLCWDFVPSFIGIVPETGDPYFDPAAGSALTRENGWRGLYGDGDLTLRAGGMPPGNGHYGLYVTPTTVDGVRKCFRDQGGYDLADANAFEDVPELYAEPIDPNPVFDDPPGPATAYRDDAQNTRLARLENDPLYLPWIEADPDDEVQHHFRIPGDFTVCLHAQTQGMATTTTPNAFPFPGDIHNPAINHPIGPVAPGEPSWIDHPGIGDRNANPNFFHASDIYGYPREVQRVHCQDLHVANLPPEVQMRTQKVAQVSDRTYQFFDHSRDPDWLPLCMGYLRLGVDHVDRVTVPALLGTPRFPEPRRCDQDGLVHWEWDFGDGTRIEGRCLAQVTSPSPLSCYDDIARTTAVQVCGTLPCNVLLAPDDPNLLQRSPTSWVAPPARGSPYYCATPAGMPSPDCQTGQDCLIRCPYHTYEEDGFYAVTLCVTDYEVLTGYNPEVLASGMFGEDDPAQAAAPYGPRDSSRRCVTEGLLVRPEPNLPPRLDPQPDVSLPVGGKFQGRIHGVDADGDPLFYAWGGFPDWIAVDPVTRVASGTALLPGAWSGITYTVTDGEYTDSRTFTVTVFDLQKDSDLDGAVDLHDNCPGTSNHDQLDVDQDGVGEACKDGPAPVRPAPDASGDGEASSGRPPAPPLPDGDGDGVPDRADNCLTTSNADQSNVDGDLRGDLCDVDLDGDGIVQATLVPGAALDNCPYVPNPDQRDDNHDLVGDACDEAHEQYQAPRAPATVTDHRQAAAPDRGARLPEGLVGSGGFALAAGLALLWGITLGLTLWAGRRWR